MLILTFSGQEVSLLEIFIAALVALFGWFLFNFFGSPLVRIFKMRDEIQSFLIRNDNLSAVDEFDTSRKSHPSYEHSLEAAKESRRLASELRALALVHRGLSNMLSSLVGFDLECAAGGLIGYSNTLAETKYRKSGEFAANRQIVEDGLKLDRKIPEDVKVRD